MAFLVQLIQQNTRKASIWDSSFNMDLEFLKFEMLLSIILPNLA